MVNKISISYCHEYLDRVKSFMKHTQKLQDDKIIKVWYDEQSNAGDVFWEKIKERLKDSDIVCLFVSASYLASKSKFAMNSIPLYRLL